MLTVTIDKCKTSDTQPHQMHVHPNDETVHQKKKSCNYFPRLKPNYHCKYLLLGASLIKTEDWSAL